ncbi:hypothetical protein ACJRO7_012896 [Eucalyptus globulus]|uniref:NAC domain-containing protein n=1 Tax=Eucalyptus globulus TaxID=34317 RepID=A0ABD3LK32_EUCGL
MGAGIDEDEWYFFTPSDTKHPSRSRPTRFTPSGFWWVTGKDSVIRMENKTIGYKSSLAFYRVDSQSRSDGTAWCMHEYRLEEDEKRDRTSVDGKKGGKDKMLDEWVLCKVYTPKHGQQSDLSPKKRDRPNLDWPDGDGDCQQFSS